MNSIFNKNVLEIFAQNKFSMLQEDFKKYLLESFKEDIYKLQEYKYFFKKINHLLLIDKRFIQNYDNNKNVFNFDEKDEKNFMKNLIILSNSGSCDKNATDIYKSFIKILNENIELFLELNQNTLDQIFNKEKKKLLIKSILLLNTENNSSNDIDFVLGNLENINNFLKYLKTLNTNLMKNIIDRTPIQENLLNIFFSRLLNKPNIDYDLKKIILKKDIFHNKLTLIEKIHEERQNIQENIKSKNPEIANLSENQQKWINTSVENLITNLITNTIISKEIKLDNESDFLIELFKIFKTNLYQKNILKKTQNEFENICQKGFTKK